MAAALPSTQESETAYRKGKLNGGSGKRKRNEPGVEQRTRAAESVQARTSRSAITKVKGGSDRRNTPSQKSIGRSRQNSLRRVKDSTDALRERSLQTQLPKKAVVAAEGVPGGREGRKFTVGNVGNNGMIYLRFASHDKTSQDAT